MPTLLASQSTQPAQLPHSDVPPAAAIILSFNGVDFKLEPLTSTSEVSYKNEPDNLILSLTGFTGTLKVCKTSLLSSGLISSTTATATATTKVEDDPNSPETLSKKKPKKVSPGQQTLPFTAAGKTVKSKSSKRNNKKTDKNKSQDIKTIVSHLKDDKTPEADIEPRSDENKNRKRRIVARLAKTPTNTKRSRSTSTTTTTIDSFLPPISMGQASQPTQPTQLDDDDGVDMGAEDDVLPNTTADTMTITEKSKPLFLLPSSEKKETKNLSSTSVQDILDGNDSVATVRESDDDDIGSGDIVKHEEYRGDNNNGKGYDGDDIINVVNSETTVVEDGDVTTIPNPPATARWGHTMTQIEKGEILVYGGASYDKDGDPIILSDVHVYDPKNGGSWHAPINCRGEARQWHSSTYIPGRKQIIAFGGEQTNKGKTITSDTLRVLDTEIMLWYPPAASGDIPTGRSGHTATFFPETNELIIFGGVTKGSKFLNSVTILDVNRWIWTTPNVVGTAPKPRSYQSATSVGSQKMVIFGGNNKTSCFDTVHVLNRSNDGDASTGWKWSNPSLRGKAPLARTGHTATLLEDGKTIMVYGGWDPNEEDELTGEDNIFKGSYLLDTQEWTWKKGPDPQPYDSVNTNNPGQDCGARRCGHAAASNSENGEVFLFGGRIPGEVLAGDLLRIVPPLEKMTF
mmetsp:Transcript_34247/g.38332  ORF Transcript_34247/g.38332 Transcript_34247/m.38332 type:complete len:685 (+) Transcript_34247:178-2232(+)